MSAHCFSFHGGHGKAERLGRRKIDDELEFAGLF
jgi:hypothetical protein